MSLEASSWRVLIMEDDGLLAMFITEALNELGYVVVGPVRTVEDGLQRIQNERIDIALLDVNLGNGRTTYPVAALLRERGVPFAFLTGYGENGVSSEFRDRPVIAKPVDQKSLAETLGILGSNLGT